MWAAAASGATLVVLAALSYSPFFRIRTVSWTGPLRLSEEQYRALEAASLGRPLLLLSERRVAGVLGGLPRTARMDFRRHLPGTLEVNLAPRRAFGLLDAETAVDARGRRLPPEHALAGLPRLVGFELEPGGKRLEPRGRAALGALADLATSGTLVPEEIRLEEDEIDLVLADTGTRVRFAPVGLAAQLLKLRVFEESLGSDPLPASIDLRFADQVVVRERGTRVASRSAR